MTYNNKIRELLKKLKNAYREHNSEKVIALTKLILNYNKKNIKSLEKIDTQDFNFKYSVDRKGDIRIHMI